VAESGGAPGIGGFTSHIGAQDVGKASYAYAYAQPGPRDVVDTVLGFARTLRHAGVTASPDRVEAMLAALDSLDVLNPTDVYWAGRLARGASPAK
jgi:uncharacterized protein with von Willebrand factor type A (vWA) domain